MAEMDPRLSALFDAYEKYKRITKKLEVAIEKSGGLVNIDRNLAKRIEAQTNIENLLKAKGFSEALAVISDETVTVVVRSEGLLSSETMQIQDIATEQSGISLSGVKIITVK